ncbi:hypothetical protein LSCM4_05882 [Leishmania orientalis]|uniref:Uncharacterized protein n=1 Tax=Leishmania orientalis TaxID=2249476 RepID=A0A836GVH7_9TRYP|nr:hypothetical protein LSCM4_05882 [Leishmania orientalis]
MSRVPGSSRGQRAPVDRPELPLIREEQRAAPIAPALGSSTSLASSAISGRRGVPFSGTRTVSSLYREGACSSNILSRMVTHATRATAPRGRGQQPSHLQAPPRLAPLPAVPIVERGFGLPQTALAPLALAGRSEGALCARRRARVAAGAGAICMCSARSALPHQPLSTAMTAMHWVEPEPVWRRSRPLARLPATTQGHRRNCATSSPDNLNVALSNASVPGEGTQGWQGAEALAQPTAAEPTQDPEAAVCHVDYRAIAAQTDCFDRFFAVSGATESSQTTLPDPRAPPAVPPHGASAQSNKRANQLVEAAVGSGRVRRTGEEGAVNVSTLSSSAPSFPGIRSGRSALSSGCGVFWAHEAPEQPSYAHKHQLPVIFSRLVQDLLAAKPKAVVESDDGPLGRWIQSWFQKRCLAQPQPQPHRHSVKHLRDLDEDAVAATVLEAYIRGERSSDCVEPRQKATLEEGDIGDTARAGSAAHPAAGPCTTSTAAAVALTAMPKPASSASLLQPSSAASPRHQYIPLTAEYIRSGLESRMTSGASQRATTPQKPSQTQPPPLRPAALHSAGAISSPRPPNSVADGSGGVLAAVAGRPPSSQQSQQPLPAKPQPGGTHFPAPPSARSMSSKQTVVAAAALAGSSDSDKGASGIRPKLATTAYAVLAHSSSSSAAKEAAHPQE